MEKELTFASNSNESGTLDIFINVHGSDWYYAVTAVMGFATACFIGLSLTKPRSQRIFHYITASITMIATIAYYSMGSNLGWAAIAVEFPRSDPGVTGTYREIFYARYIDWYGGTFCPLDGTKCF
jgi:bacteriorhodopsin